jgi:hypothetical protein
MAVSKGEDTAVRCPSVALQLAVGNRISEPTGQHSLALTLTNRSSSPCFIFGYPKVSLLDSSGGELPFDYRRGGDTVVTSHSPTRVEVSPGGTAYVTINKYRCDIGDHGLTTTVELTPPGEALSLAVAMPPDAITLGYCGPGDPGTVVFVSPVESTPEDTVVH